MMMGAFFFAILSIAHYSIYSICGLLPNPNHGKELHRVFRLNGLKKLNWFVRSCERRWDELELVGYNYLFHFEVTHCSCCYSQFVNFILHNSHFNLIACGDWVEGGGIFYFYFLNHQFTHSQGWENAHSCGVNFKRPSNLLNWYSYFRTFIQILMLCTQLWLKTCAFRVGVLCTKEHQLIVLVELEGRDMTDALERKRERSNFTAVNCEMLSIECLIVGRMSMSLASLASPASRGPPFLITLSYSNFGVFVGRNDKERIL